MESERLVSKSWMQLFFSTVSIVSFIPMEVLYSCSMAVSLWRLTNIAIWVMNVCEFKSFCDSLSTAASGSNNFAIWRPVYLWWRPVVVGPPSPDPWHYTQRIKRHIALVPTIPAKLSFDWHATMSTGLVCLHVRLSSPSRATSLERCVVQP